MKIQCYFNDELDQELGQFDADFLLDFISKDIGSYFYNRGIYDAQQIMSERVEQITDAIYQLEQPIS